jgi:hypothetical protein
MQLLTRDSMHEGDADPCSLLIRWVFRKEIGEADLLILYSFPEEFDEDDGEEEGADDIA